MKSSHFVSWTALLAFTAGLFLAGIGHSTEAGTQKKRKNESSLAGLKPGRDRLKTAVNLHGPYYKRVRPDSESEVYWADSIKRRVLRIKLDEKGIIEAVTVSTLDPILDSADPKGDVPLPSPKLLTGRGVRIAHDGYGDVMDTYGEPDVAEEVLRHGITVSVMVYMFDKEPKFLEVSCERGGGRVLQIRLAMEPDEPKS
jgi:hypothetical protein